MRYSIHTAVQQAKPTFRRPVLTTDASFNVKIDVGKTLMTLWHYHPELELILLERTSGMRIIGTSVEPFLDNDVFLIGKNVPHVFLHENALHQDKYPQGNYFQTESPQAVVIQFDENFMGKDFLNLPELRDIQNLFCIARQGLCLAQDSKREVIPLMKRMLNASSLDRIITLLEILRILVNKNAFQPLMKEGFLYQLKEDNDDRIKAITHYTSLYYDQNITIEKMAKMVHLTKESFCRYFKSQTGKTYMEFLIEFRIRAACQKLMEHTDSIKEVGYACGFDSLSNFHYQFKKIMKISPLEYRSKCMARIKKIHDPE